MDANITLLVKEELPSLYDLVLSWVEPLLAETAVLQHDGVAWENCGTESGTKGNRWEWIKSPDSLCKCR